MHQLMRILRRNRHLLRDHAQGVLRMGVDYRGTNTAVTCADYHTTRHIRVPSQINKISRHHVYILSTIYPPIDWVNVIRAIT